MLQWLRSKLRRRAPEAVVAAPVPVPVVEKQDDVLAALLSVAAEPEADDQVMLQLGVVIREEMRRGSLQIPPLPSSAARLLELVHKPDVDLNQLVAALHWEPALVARVLAVANTAAFRGPSGKAYDDLRGAIIAMGLRMVGEIAAGVAARTMFQVESRMEYDLFPALWQAAHRETMIVAFGASAVAHARNLPRPDRVFLRALLAGAGRTLALRALAGPLIEGNCPRPTDEQISAAVDFSYRAVGELAVAHGTLPGGLIEADASELAAVDLVAAIVELRRTPGRAAVVARAKQGVEALGLQPAWLKVILRECDDAEKRVSAMIGAN